MTLIDVREIAALMGRLPAQVWNYHRYARDLQAGTRRGFANPMPMPKVEEPEKLWDEDDIHYWIEARQKTRSRVKPSLNMRPSESRHYPAAARKLALFLGLQNEGVKREFDVSPNYDNGTVTVSLTTRHTLPISEFQFLLRESQK